jgi:glutamate formiminotransferase
MSASEIAKRYQIPVYLYEAAAATPERQNLENIRRGQFEGIRDEIAVNPARKPDFGDPRVHPTAGATVVGARKALIAYNVFLNTPDVDIAKKSPRLFASHRADCVRQGRGISGARPGPGLHEPDRL